MSTSGGKFSHDPLASAALPDGDSTDPQAIVADVNDRTQIINANDLKPLAPVPSFKLLVLAGPKAGSEFLIDTDDFTIGRAVENIVPIPDVSVSRKHARFVRSGNGFEVSDLKSGNGTKLNGKPITSTQVGHGDELTFGDTVVQVIDLTAPLPERMKPIHTLQSPSGSQGAPNTTTQLENVKVAAPVAELTPKLEAPPAAEAKQPNPPASPPPAKEPAKKAKPAAAGPNKRVKLYVAVGAVMVVFFAVAAVLKPPPAPPPDPGNPLPPVVDGEEWPEEVVKARKAVVERRDWAAALAALEPLKKQGGATGIAKAWLEAVPKEFAEQQKLKNAQRFLNEGDFRAARDLAKGIPEAADVYPEAQGLLESIEGKLVDALAEARQLAQSNRERALRLVNGVLNLQPDNTEAQALRDELSRPIETPKVVVAKNEPKHEVKPTPTPTPVANKDPFAGPWLDAYLEGRLPDALRAAEGSTDPDIRDKFLMLLQNFRKSYTEGMQAAESKRIPEAAKSLQVAFGLDKQISGGKTANNKPGREVRKQLANMEYILSLDCKGDDQLSLKAKHLRIALEADPTHELALKAQKDAFERAKAVYQEAYVDKSANPEKAKRQFKIVVATLPQGEEYRDKAQYWLDKM